MNGGHGTVACDVLLRLLKASEAARSQDVIDAIEQSSQQALTLGVEGTGWARSLETTYQIRRAQGARVAGLEETVAAIDRQIDGVSAAAIAGPESLFLVVMDEQVTKVLGIIAATLANQI